MRGGELEDVIFDGTASRPSRNFAEVTLTIDNSSRKAPASLNDSDEIEVTRRIDRGKGSQFRINGKIARAKDVQLLFADMATGPRSSGIVSQGKVDALINAKPVTGEACLKKPPISGGCISAAMRPNCASIPPKPISTGLRIFSFNWTSRKHRSSNRHGRRHDIVPLPTGSARPMPICCWPDLPQP